MGSQLQLIPLRRELPININADRWVARELLATGKDPAWVGILKTGFRAHLQFKLAGLAECSDASNERGSVHLTRNARRLEVASFQERYS
jgi:hypothetical protein